LKGREREVSKRALELAIAVSCGILGWLLFSRIPVAQSDYVHYFRPATLDWVSGTTRLYADTPGFRNPPWTVLLLFPFTLLSVRLGAGLVRLLTVGSALMAAHTLGEGRLGRSVGGVLALFSLPMLNALYRVQLVGFVVLGVALGHVALRRRSPFLLVLALLLVTVKPQLSILLALLWLWIVLRDWPARSRRCVVACCAGGLIGTLVLFGPRWPLDWLGESRNWLDPNHPALISSPWRAGAVLGLPAWTPVLLALALGLAGGPGVIRGRGQSPLMAGWAVALAMLLLPYQHSFDSLALLALALPPAAEISLPLACSLYVLSFSQFLHVFTLPHWLGAALPVGGALVLTGLCWQQGRRTGRLTPGDWHAYAESDAETPPGGRGSVG
jgi:hypothetical protein